MDLEKCKGCKYFSSYYHGGAVGTIQFSYRCWWTVTDPRKVKKEECHKETEE